MQFSGFEVCKVLIRIKKNELKKNLFSSIEMENYIKYKAKIEQSNGPKITYDNLDEDDFGDDDDSNDEYNQKKPKYVRKSSQNKRKSNENEEIDAKRTKSVSSDEDCSYYYYPIKESPNMFEYYPEENILLDSIIKEDMAKSQETLEIETLKEVLKREVFSMQKNDQIHNTSNNYDNNYSMYDDGYSSLNSSPELCEKLEFDDSILGEYQHINWQKLYDDHKLINC